MKSKKIVLEEDFVMDEETWQEILKKAEQTGENPDMLAEQFICFYNELASDTHVDPEILAVRRLTSNKNYKAAV